MRDRYVLTQFILCFLTFISFFTIPILSLNLFKNVKDNPNFSILQKMFLSNYNKLNEKEKSIDENHNLKISNIEISELTVFDTKNNKNFNMDFEEYMLGVLIGEMPASFEIEALKAQVVAARSYILDKVLNCGSSIPEHNGAVICTNPNHCKAWISVKEAEALWGKDWINKYLKKLKKAVNETNGEYMVCDNKIVKAFFFSMSSGKTELPEEVWVSALPYLKSVESPYEQYLPNFYSEKQFSLSDFINVIKNEKNEFNFDSSPLIGNTVYTTGGCVKEIELGNVKIKGTEIRRMFGLKSANFTLDYDENSGIITFHNKGHGHGVGMSQYGANEFAKRGKNYREILEHYYSGIEFNKIRKS